MATTMGVNLMDSWSSGSCLDVAWFSDLAEGKSCELTVMAAGSKSNSGLGKQISKIKCLQKKMKMWGAVMAKWIRPWRIIQAIKPVITFTAWSLYFAVCQLLLLHIQWNLVIKRSDITKPSYNKVILLVSALYSSLFFYPDIMRNLI